MPKLRPNALFLRLPTTKAETHWCELTFPKPSRIPVPRQFLKPKPSVAHPLDANTSTPAKVHLAHFDGFH
ncbi:hypothetical protein ONZ45_g6260 [Pleurotus djamor]|nr:hypothetical protein ONZ45_g6260 [Pleurotus djamor]